MRKPRSSNNPSRTEAGAPRGRRLAAGIPFYVDPSSVRAGVGTYAGEFVAQAISNRAADEIRLFVDGGVSLEERAATRAEEETRARQALRASAGGARWSVHHMMALSREMTDGEIALCHHPYLSLLVGFVAICRVRELAGAAVPVLSTVHALEQPEIVYHLEQILLSGNRPYDSLVCPSTSARTALSRMLDTLSAALEEQHGVRLSYQGRLDVVPHGVDTAAFQRSDRAWSRTLLHLPAKALVLLFAGRVTPIDKADLLPLLHVFSRLSRRRAQKDLLLFIAGPCEPDIQNAIFSCCAHLGLSEAQVVMRDIPAGLRQVAFAAADVFVSPADSAIETFGLSVLEALACGVPQVVSDWDGYREIVDHGFTGFLLPTCWSACDQDARIWSALVSPGSYVQENFSFSQSVAVDVAAMERALEALIASPELRSRMAEASRRRAEDVFAWPRIVSRYRELWQELIEHARREGPVPAGVRPWYRSSFAEILSVHASRLVSDDSRVRLTDDGIEIASGRQVLPAYYAVLDVRIPQALEALMRVLGTRRRWSTLGRLIASAQRNGPFHPDQLRRAALWLLKYGLIELEGEGRFSGKPRLRRQLRRRPLTGQRKSG